MLKTFVKATLMSQIACTRRFFIVRSVVYISLFYFKAVDIEPKMYEGDIVTSSNPEESPEVRQKRNAQRLRQYIWKSKIVPYEVSEILGKISL